MPGILARQRKRPRFGARKRFEPRTPATPPPDPGRFEEAIDFFRARVPMRKGGWIKLGTAARQRGFTVADVTQLDVIHQVWLALDDAIARGATFDEFKETVTPALTEAWEGKVKNPPARIEAIFRTNVMQANNAGRHAQMTDPAVLERRPFWQYVDVDDGLRECPICTACHGVILRYDDPWWDTHSPPLHHQCRCRRRPLTEKQAIAQGVTIAAPQAPPDQGFGAPPQEVAQPFRVDLSKYPSQLQIIAREKMEIR